MLPKVWNYLIKRYNNKLVLPLFTVTVEGKDQSYRGTCTRSKEHYRE